MNRNLIILLMFIVSRIGMMWLTKAFFKKNISCVILN